MDITPQNAIAWLPGTWHIQATNFPMWLKGDKLAPTFNYAAAGEGRLLDVVRYRRAKDGSTGEITGYDTAQGDGSEFVWRGKGLLFIARSRWQVTHVAPSGEWAVIRFARTLFTPAGLDVITRAAEADKLRMEVKRVLRQDVAMGGTPVTWLGGT